MFGFFENKKDTAIINDRNFLKEVTDNSLQSVLHLNFHNISTKKKGTVCLITDPEMKCVDDKIKLFTYYGDPVTVDLVSLHASYLNNAVVKIDNVWLANEKETNSFLNDFLMVKDNSLKNKLSSTEVFWQNNKRDTEFENEDKLYFCKVGKTYKFLDMDDNVVKGEILATKTVRFGDYRPLSVKYYRMTGLYIQEFSEDNTKKEQKTCIHCVSINYDENIPELFQSKKLVDNEEVIHVQDKPVYKTFHEEIYRLKETEIVKDGFSENKDVLKPKKGKYYQFLVKDDYSSYDSQGFFVRKDYGLYLFRNGFRDYYINPKNLSKLNPLKERSVLEDIPDKLLEKELKIVNRYGEEFCGCGLYHSFDDELNEIVALKNGKYNDYLKNVVFIYGKKQGKWELLWHR